MLPSLYGTNNVGTAHHPVSSGAYTVDTMLNELSRQLTVNTRRYSRASNAQPRGGNSMRISKPGSANSSPRTSALHSRRRTLIGDGFQGRLQTRSPVMDQAYLPTPASETPSESFYGRETRPARPVSWHPSSQYAQQSPFPQQDSSNNVLYPFPAYSDAEMPAALQQMPPTPTVYSGYTSPAESFSPLSLPYSNFASQQMCSPVSQPLSIPQQQEASVYPPAACSDYPSTGTVSDIAYLPPSQAAKASFAWEPCSVNTAMLSRHTAPPTPEDFACSLMPNQAAGETTAPLLQQQHPSQQPTKQSTAVTNQQSFEPLIRSDENDEESEGEILYGMGLYDAPDHSRPTSLHQSVILSLLGGAVDPKEAPDSGKGLGLKLEDAWEPPASEDEEDGEDDVEGQEEA
ncbi:hypothetical protein C8A03DRAFT_14706 [Achaetomium macrosporum]|uniref:Uncharacterized protein n=1 Tax=Achaetomium macrosporum TaxID=79813 RepID=A0AAN7CBG6_9PEZI|nr:hypothetical protein C8A03DRAFT_14706 [Achaetomium macrosporum]